MGLAGSNAHKMPRELQGRQSNGLFKDHILIEGDGEYVS